MKRPYPRDPQIHFTWKQLTNQFPRIQVPPVITTWNPVTNKKAASPLTGNHNRAKGLGACGRHANMTWNYRTNQEAKITCFLSRQIFRKHGPTRGRSAPVITRRKKMENAETKWGHCVPVAQNRAGRKYDPLRGLLVARKREFWHMLSANHREPCVTHSRVTPSSTMHAKHARNECNGFSY